MSIVPRPTYVEKKTSMTDYPSDKHTGVSGWSAYRTVFGDLAELGHCVSPLRAGLISLLYQDTDGYGWMWSCSNDLFGGLSKEMWSLELFKKLKPIKVA